jgi:hypothetical protein
MNLIEFNNLVNNGYITNVALIEYYNQHQEELNHITINELLNRQGGRIVADYSNIVDDATAAPKKVDETTTVAPEKVEETTTVAPEKVEETTTVAPKKVDETTTVAPEKVEIVVDEGEDDE